MLSADIKSKIDKLWNNLLAVLDDKTISLKTGLIVDKVRTIRII